jgi:hypothetical protein
MGASLPTRIKACFNAVEISQFTFNQKVEGYVISWDGYAYVFCNTRRVLLAHFQKRGENVNCLSYWEVLLKLRDAIHRNLPGQLRRGILLHRENAKSYTARASQERIQELQLELLEHPPYSPDLAPSNFHLFRLLKTTLVANVSLMKKLKRRCGSDWDNSRKTSVLRVSTQW